MSKRLERSIAEGHEKTFWSNMNALYVDYHGGYTGLYVFQNLLKCTIESVILLYANYTFIKIKKKTTLHSRTI